MHSSSLASSEDTVSSRDHPFSSPSRIAYNLPYLERVQTPVETCDHNAYTADDKDQMPNWPEGWRPWVSLFGCFLLMFNSWGLVNAYGTFASFYSMAHLKGRSTILLNLIGSTQSFIVLISSFVAGRLLDAGHSRKLIFVGAVLVTVGMFALSAVPEGNYGAIWATQGLIVGLGMACFFVTSSQVAATWFIKRKTIAIGIVACGASIAGVIYPILIRFLLQKCSSFGIAVCYFSLMVCLVAFIALFLASPNPAQIARKPDNWARLSVWVDMDAFRNPAFNWFTAGICFMFFGFYSIFFNFEDWAASKGLAAKMTPTGILVKGQRDAMQTYWFLCIMNGSSTLGRLSAATLAEKFGTLNVHSAATFIGSMLVLILWSLASNQTLAICYCVLFGAISGAIIGLPPASIAFILGRSDPTKQAKLGHWTGMMYTISASFALTGPVIVGHLYGQYGIDSYVLQGWAGGCLFLSSVCMVIARLYTGAGRVAGALARAKELGLTISRTVTRSKDDGRASMVEKV